MVLPFKDYNDVFILGGTDDVQVNLDESNINIQTIASSRHVGPIKPRVDEWVKQLEIFGKTLVSFVYRFVSRLFVVVHSCVCFSINTRPRTILHR